MGFDATLRGLASVPVPFLADLSVVCLTTSPSTAHGNGHASKTEWAWTDNNGRPEDAVSRQKILDEISVYWFTASAASSAVTHGVA